MRLLILPTLSVRAGAVAPLALSLLFPPDLFRFAATGWTVKKAVSIDDARYTRIDAHALAAPAEARRSIPALAAYLAAPAQDDHEKARAIFRWVTANISYVDEEADPALDLRPEAVLERGTAVCAGYSDLFVSLARAAGLEAVEIEGWARGYGTGPGSHFGGPKNHAWNAVRIDGAWRLIDCTWGAGSVDEEGVYRKRFQPFYFLTPPQKLRYSHFPNRARWQLLEPPVSLAEFEALPFLRPAFFRCGLFAPEPHACTLQAPDPLVSVRLDAPRDAMLLVRLFREGEMITPAGLRVRSKKGQRSIDLLLPASGEYLLRVYVSCDGENPDGARRFSGALEYRVEAKGGAPDGSIGSYLKKRVPPR